MSKLRAVEVTSPARITIAIGPSISRPGSPLPIAIGSNPSAATSAVIRTGSSLSEAPRSAVSRPHDAPSAETRCSKWEIIMIELRVLMPNNVTSPTSDPNVSHPPLKKMARTPPARANGRFAKTSVRFCKLWKAIASRRSMAIPAMTDETNISCWD